MHTNDRRRMAQTASRLLDEASAVIAAADRESRGMTPAELERYEALMAEQVSLSAHLRETDPAGEPAGAAQTRGRDEGIVPFTTAEGAGAILAPEARCAAWVASRSGAYSAEVARGERLSVGAVLAAMVTGDRRRLSNAEARALAEGTDSAGGFLTPDLMAASFIDRVRQAMRVIEAGARTVPMESDTLTIPRLAGGATPAWKVENDPIAGGDLTFEGVKFTARTLPFKVALSVELFEDAPHVSEILERELAGALALELDRAAIRGSGVAPEPKGIRFQPGVSVVNVAAPDGATPATYAFLVDRVADVWGANFAPTAAIYNARTAATFAKFTDQTDQPLRMPAALEQFPHLVTSQIPSDLVTGTNNDTSEAYVGDFRECLIGLRTTFRLEASRVAGDAFDKMQVHVRAYLRADVQLAHPAAFSVAIGVRG